MMRNANRINVPQVNITLHTFSQSYDENYSSLRAKCNVQVETSSRACLQFHMAENFRAVTSWQLQPLTGNFVYVGVSKTADATWGDENNHFDRRTSEIQSQTRNSKLQAWWRNWVKWKTLNNFGSEFRQSDAMLQVPCSVLECIKNFESVWESCVTYCIL